MQINKKANIMLGLLIAVAVIIVIGLIFFSWIAGSYNTLVQKDVGVGKAWGNVQTSYQRRADLIPNLVATVKGSASFEKETQTQIAAMRSGITNAKTPSELDSVGKQMNGLISNLIVAVEAYPDLKSSQNFLALQDELAGTENRINWERNNYNDAVKDYQISVRRFPTNIIAGMFGFSLDKWNMFQASEGSDKAPQVNFG